MNLEDHAGDIVRKARTAANLSLAAIAQAAGLNEEDWATFEDSRIGARPIPYEVLGPILALDGKKLAGIARGWLPAPHLKLASSQSTV